MVTLVPPQQPWSSPNSGGCSDWRSAQLRLRTSLKTLSRKTAMVPWIRSRRLLGLARALGLMLRRAGCESRMRCGLGVSHRQLLHGANGSMDGQLSDGTVTSGHACCGSPIPDPRNAHSRDMRSLLNLAHRDPILRSMLRLSVHTFLLQLSHPCGIRTTMARFILRQCGASQRCCDQRCRNCGRSSSSALSLDCST